MNRTIKIMVRVTEEEMTKIKEMAAAEVSEGKKMNVSKYIRQKIFSDTVTEHDLKKAMKDITYQIRKIGVNVNQVAAKVNRSYCTGNDTQTIKIELLRVEDLLSKLIRKADEFYGHYKD